MQTYKHFKVTQTDANSFTIVGNNGKIDFYHRVWLVNGISNCEIAFQVIAAPALGFESNMGIIPTGYRPPFGARMIPALSPGSDVNNFAQLKHSCFSIDSGGNIILFKYEALNVWYYGSVAYPALT